MDQLVIKFLEEQHVCVITTIMCDGMPHPAAMHYSMLNNPFTLFFCIDDRSITAQNVSVNGKMAVLVGCNEEMPKTLQMRGEVSIVKDPSELVLSAATFYTRYPDSRQFENDPHTAFLSFTPHWHRFSDPRSDPSRLVFFMRGLKGEVLNMSLQHRKAEE